MVRFDPPSSVQQNVRQDANEAVQDSTIYVEAPQVEDTPEQLAHAPNNFAPAAFPDSGASGETGLVTAAEDVTPHAGDLASLPTPENPESAVRAEAEGIRGAIQSINDQIDANNDQIDVLRGEIHNIQVRIQDLHTQITNLHINIGELQKLIIELQNDFVDLAARLQFTERIRDRIAEELKSVDQQIGTWERRANQGFGGGFSGGFNRGGWRGTEDPTYTPIEGGIAGSGLGGELWGTQAPSIALANDMLSRDPTLAPESVLPASELRQANPTYTVQAADSAFNAFLQKHRPQGNRNTDPTKMVEALKEYKANLEGMLKEANDEIASIKTQMVQVQERIERAKGAIEQYKEMIKQKEAEIEKLEEEIVRLQEQINEIQEQNVKLQEERNKLEEELRKAQEEIQKAAEERRSQEENDQEDLKAFSVRAIQRAGDPRLRG